MTARSRTLLMAAVLAVESGATFAAHVIRAPIADLLEPTNTVAVLRYQGRDQDREQFHTVETLWGNARKEVSLQAIDALDQLLTSGQRYIVVYSLLRHHPRFRDITEPDPGGAHVVEVNVAGPALFEDHASLRFLFRALQKPHPPAGKILSALLDLIGTSHGHTRLLASFEFYMRQELYAEGFTPALAQRYRGLVESGTLSPQEQEFMLHASRFFPNRFRLPWIAETCRKTIRDHPAQYDLGSFVPLLSKTCAKLLGENGAASDVALLSTRLYSNSPGVAKAALSAMTRLDASAALHVVRQARQSDGIHPETRRTLDLWLQSLSKNTAVPTPARPGTN